MSYRPKQEKILLMGSGGAGKSSSIASIFKILSKSPQLRVFVLVTERNALSGLDWGLKYHNIKLQKGQLITSVVRNKKKKAFVNQKRAMEGFSQQSQGEIMKADASNMGKDKYNDFTNTIGGLTSFTGEDYLTKEEFTLGNIGLLEETDILVIDGLTPIMLSLWEAILGDRVGTGQSDYLICQKQLMKLTKGLIDLECSVILLAHIDKLQDDIEKKELIRVSLDAGVALAGKYSGWWGDTIYQYKDPISGKRFWSGKKAGVEISVRNIPEQDKLEPDFSKYNLFIEEIKG